MQLAQRGERERERNECIKPLTSAQICTYERVATKPDEETLPAYKGNALAVFSYSFTCRVFIFQSKPHTHTHTSKV